MSRKRFIVEAEWNHSGQQCHRTVETLFRAGYEALGCVFSGGTSMTITVRDAKPRERVEQKPGFSSLLRYLAMKKWSELRESTSGAKE